MVVTPPRKGEKRRSKRDTRDEEEEIEVLIAKKAKEEKMGAQSPSAKEMVILKVEEENGVKEEEDDSGTEDKESRYCNVFQFTFVVKVNIISKHKSITSTQFLHFNNRYQQLEISCVKKFCHWSVKSEMRQCVKYAE